MEQATLVSVRKVAEESVMDMAEGPLKIAAFQTVFGKLLDRSFSNTSTTNRSSAHSSSRAKSSGPLKGTTERLVSLISEGFFGEPKTLTDIKQALAEKGWHYRLGDLGTPVARLVRRKDLRRTQGMSGAKKLWRYSNY